MAHCSPTSSGLGLAAHIMAPWSLQNNVVVLIPFLYLSKFGTGLDALSNVSKKSTEDQPNVHFFGGAKFLICNFGAK
jgi:hypothetical protein